MIKHIKHLTGCYVEIGTDQGNTAELLLNKTNCSKLYCIDPYMNYDEYSDAINTVTGDHLYNKVLNRLSKYNNRVEVIRLFSDQAVDLIPDDLDFIYIDGNHSYNYVIDDLNNWYPKLKKGGILIGDDYVDLDDTKRNENGDVFIQWSPNCFGHYGVKKAFTEFIQKNNIINYEIIDKQIIIRK